MAYLIRPGGDIEKQPRWPFEMAWNEDVFCATALRPSLNCPARSGPKVSADAHLPRCFHTGCEGTEYCTETAAEAQ